jgi:quinol-cytochrome oxidoreductase complex cytochrome b subunit
MKKQQYFTFQKKIRELIWIKGSMKFLDLRSIKYFWYVGSVGSYQGMLLLIQLLTCFGHLGGKSFGD